MTFFRSIAFENYKRFERFNISCRETNIFVGPNNAGKSTILDSLRIFGAVHRYAQRTRPTYAEHDGVGGCATYTLPHTLIGMPIENVVRNYGDDVAKITIVLQNDSTVHMHLHPERPVLAFVESDERVPRTTREYNNLVPVDLIVVPALSALESDEEYVLDETVSRNENTRLASRNFRNIILRKTQDEFIKFRELVSQGWENIDLLRPEITRREKPYVTMMYSENRFERELCWSGFGFQVWLQMALQFLRGDKNSLLVLDEPDIYLHPDLQKRLVRLAKERFGQIFLATHSSEIINEAESGDILLVDSGNRTARRVSSEDSYRRLYNYIGSSDNAEFARLARSDRIIFFEGNDKKLVRKLALIARLDDIFQDSKTAYLQTGGFSQWTRVREVDWALHNIFGLNIRIASVFDRDYRCEEEIRSFLDNLGNENLWVDILDKKEIENYLLVPEPMISAIRRRLATRGHEIDEAEVADRIYRLADTFHDECRTQQIASYISYHREANRHAALQNHIAEATRRFEDGWRHRETQLSLVPGKQFLSALSAALQDEFQVSLTANQILDEMTAEHVPEDLVVRLRSMAEFLRR